MLLLFIVSFLVVLFFFLNRGSLCNEAYIHLCSGPTIYIIFCNILKEKNNCILYTLFKKNS